MASSVKRVSKPVFKTTRPYTETEWYAASKVTHQTLCSCNAIGLPSQLYKERTS